VAADEVVRSVPNVYYFPAYEIVTGSQAPWEFYEADRRNVSRAAVDTVMAAFLARCEAGEVQAVGRGADEAAAFGEFAVMAECEEMMSDPAVWLIRSTDCWSPPHCEASGNAMPEPRPIPRGSNLLSFNDASDAVYYLQSGFSFPEPHFVWTDGETATVVLPLADPFVGRLSCRFHYFKPNSGTVAPVGLTVTLIMGGAAICTANDADDGMSIGLEVNDMRLSGPRELVFQIGIQDAYCPWTAGLSNDKRLLGMALQAISLSY
jgi:hypothetical protein